VPNKTKDFSRASASEPKRVPYYILYSMFWGNRIDVLVISIAGTIKELWNAYAPTFDKMRKRFEK
jgi:hypothetical protein